MSTNKRQIDPVLVSVISKRLKSITEEMAHVLLYSARSPILSEARDFVTGVYDAQGRMLAQSEFIPILAFCLSPCIRHMIDYYGDDLHPGDVILHNDPFTYGNQSADVKAAKPVFLDGKLVAWVAISGHQADIGGSVPGGYNPRARTIWEEALRIPPVKVYEKGKLRRDVWDLIFANVKLPVVEEDIKAIIGGCTVGERRVLELINHYDLDRFMVHVERMFDVTEEKMRKEIEAIPDGTYTGEWYAFGDTANDDARMKIRLTITVEGSNITFDYEGTDPQTVGYVNAPLTSTISSTLLSFLMIVGSDIPHNQGMLRPIKIKIPEGSLLNPRYPAASIYGNHLSDQISSAMFLALHEALPEKVTAAWNPIYIGHVMGYHPDRKSPYMEILFNGSKGGSGGTYGADGYDHIGIVACAGGLFAQDAEIFEVTAPHLIRQFEYLCDSGGPGQWRGGLGVELEFEYLHGPVTITIHGDGTDRKSGTFGLFGGKGGSPNFIKLTHPDGREQVLRAKELLYDVPGGTVWYQRAGGGGGYGNPFLRPAGKVAEEVRYGYISAERARDDYAVVVDPETFDVDEEATARLRQGAVG